VTRDVRPLEEAARALARRDRSAAELASHLERHGVAEAEARNTIERLEAAGYVDDGRFAVHRAAVLAGRGWGDEAIRYELEQRSLGAEAVEAALAALEPEPARARRLVERLGRGASVARRLAAKGFAEESIDAALSSG